MTDEAEQRRVLNGAIADAMGEPLTAPNPAAPKPRKCRHPKALRRWLEDGDTVCTQCGKVVLVVVAARGRRARRRGHDIERVVAAKLGLHRVGQFGTPTDVGNVTEPFRVSVKSGSGYFSERYWRELKRQDAGAHQTRLLVVTDAPGPGRARRAMVVLDLADWIALHGLSGVAEVGEG